VRTLAADLGAALGGGAHLRSLRRTAVGGFTLDDADSMEAPTLRPMADAVRHLSSVGADPELAIAVGHGKVLDRDRLGVGNASGPWAVLDEDGELLAVYEAYGDATKPAVVIPR
jgi:tRNA pseudouridine55 synthase